MVEDEGAAGVVKSRKWYWIVFGAFCALGLAVAYLGRLEDELAGMMRFHPTVEYRQGAMFYSFEAPPDLVLATIPGPRTFRNVSADIQLPSGRRALFAGVPGMSWEGRGRQTCEVIVYDDNRPWYLRAWAGIRHRLGLWKSPSPITAARHLLP